MIPVFEGRTEFCTVCRKDTKYRLQKSDIEKVIRDRSYTFSITTAFCEECGEEISVPGLVDYNVCEIDTQYRKAEKLVSIADIEKLMNIYQIGKTPLSLALGFGEITITRYLEGQVPSKEYADVIRSVLVSPTVMQHKLTKNREKLTEAAYRKAMAAAQRLSALFSVSDEMVRSIAYIFKRLEEVTPLMLQKLLYFIQGIHLAVYHRPLFEEECRAWMHGPVFPEVYTLFQDFKYNPIEDARFALLEGTEETLNNDERIIIDLVVNTFGRYGGKVLEQITHNEDPWIKARYGYGEGVASNEPISQDSMQQYYVSMLQQYALDTGEGVMAYIHDMLKKAAESA